MQALYIYDKRDNYECSFLYHTSLTPACDIEAKSKDFMRTEFICIYVLRVESGPRVKLASCKSALNPPVVCSTDRSKAVVPVLVLLLVALWFILRGDFVVCLSVCHFVLVFFSPFNIAITSLGEERANLSAFRTFVWFVLV